MDGPSSAPLDPLASLCSIVSHRSDALSIETSSLVVRGYPDDHVDLVAAFLQQLHRQVAKLGKLLSARTAVLSARLQTALNNALYACDGLLQKMDMQFMLLNSDGNVDLEGSFLALHLRCVVRYVLLFGYITDLVLLHNPEEQDTSLGGKAGRRLIEQVESACSIAAGAAYLLQRDSMSCRASGHRRSRMHNEPPPASVSNEPPSYSPPAASSPKQQPTRTPTGSSSLAESTTESTKGLLSFKKPFKALAAGLRSKHEPFVSALCQAVTLGDDRQVAGLLSQGANANGRNEKGDTPYKCAIIADQPEALRLLLNAGAQCKPSDLSGLPPLFYAATIGSFKVAKFLLDGHAMIHDASRSGYTYFSVVAHRGSAVGVQFLLENGARPGTVDESGQPILLAAVKRGDVKVVNLLLDYGAAPTSTDNIDDPILITAFDTGNYEMVETLIKHGASVSESSHLDKSLLLYALAKERGDIVKLLLTYGACRVTEPHDVQPMLVRVVRDPVMGDDDKRDIVRLMLEGGSAADIVDQVLKVPVICYAVETCSAEVVLQLLRFGANPNGRVASGPTMLWCATDRGRADTVKALLEYGADPNVSPGEKNTPLAQSLLKQQYTVARMLVEYGADMNAEGCQLGLTFMKAMGQGGVLDDLSRSGGGKRVRAYQNRRRVNYAAAPTPSQGSRARPDEDAPPEYEADGSFHAPTKREMFDRGL